MSASGRLTAIRWPVMLILCGALALHNVLRIAPVTLVDELRARYGVDYAGVGNVIGAYTLAYAFAQVTAGFLTDRFGPKRLLLVGLALATLGSTLFAVTAAYPLAIAARLLMGAAGGFLYTPSLAYTFAAHDPRLRGRAMGLAEAGVGAGQILGVLVLPVAFARAGLVAAFLLLPLAAVALAAAVAAGLPPITPERRRAAGSLAALAADRDFWLLLVGVAFVGMLAQVSVLSWLPTYLRQVHGFDVVAAGLSSAVVGWLVLLTTRQAGVAIAAAFLVSASMAATIPMQVVYASERFGALGAGTAIGLVNSGGQIASSVGVPVYGLLLDRGLGFGAVWGTAAALGVLRIMAVLGLREKRGPR